MSYLQDRTQAISINSEVAAIVSLRYGVPQGSVLGPLLYTIYTLQLSNIMKEMGVFYHFYACDMQLYLSFNFKEPSRLDRKYAVNRL